MSADQRNKEIIRKLYAESLNKHNTELLQNFVNHFCIQAPTPSFEGRVVKFCFRDGINHKIQASKPKQIQHSNNLNPIRQLVDRSFKPLILVLV